MMSIRKNTSANKMQEELLNHTPCLSLNKLASQIEKDINISKDKKENSVNIKKDDSTPKKDLSSRKGFSFKRSPNHQQSLKKYFKSGDNEIKNYENEKESFSQEDMYSDEIEKDESDNIDDCEYINVEKETNKNTKCKEHEVSSDSDDSMYDPDENQQFDMEEKTLSELERESETSEDEEKYKKVENKSELDNGKLLTSLSPERICDLDLGTENNINEKVEGKERNSHEDYFVGDEVKNDMQSSLTYLECHKDTKNKILEEYSKPRNKEELVEISKIENPISEDIKMEVPEGCVKNELKTSKMENRIDNVNIKEAERCAENELKFKMEDRTSEDIKIKVAEKCIENELKASKIEDKSFEDVKMKVAERFSQNEIKNNSTKQSSLEISPNDKSCTSLQKENLFKTEFVSSRKIFENNLKEMEKKVNSHNEKISEPSSKIKSSKAMNSNPKEKITQYFNESKYSSRSKGRKVKESPKKSLESSCESGNQNNLIESPLPSKSRHKNERVKLNSSSSKKEIKNLKQIEKFERETKAHKSSDNNLNSKIFSLFGDDCEDIRLHSSPQINKERKHSHVKSSLTNSKMRIDNNGGKEKQKNRQQDVLNSSRSKEKKSLICNSKDISHPTNNLRHTPSKEKLKNSKNLDQSLSHENTTIDYDKNKIKIVSQGTQNNSNISNNRKENSNIKQESSAEKGRQEKENSNIKQESIAEKVREENGKSNIKQKSIPEKVRQEDEKSNIKQESIPEKVRQEIADRVIKHLMPYYREKRICSKDLFKKLARFMTYKISDNENYNDEEVTKEYIHVYFSRIKCLKSETDIPSIF